jgi:hypothetical protein
MKILVWICLLYMHTSQTFDMNRIRSLYRSAPTAKQDAIQLQDLLKGVNNNTAVPVLVCYKGASEMIQAKYAFNPFTKWEKFSKGKQLLQQAISRDTLDLEMRFIRFSIQSNLPGFLGYHDELNTDKRFLAENTKKTKDPELKKMISNYLNTLKN